METLKVHFQKDFKINRYINSEIKYACFLMTVKYHWVMSAVSEQERLAV